MPDYLTSVSDGGFYGWPYSYYGQHVDERVKPQRPGSRRDGDRARTTRSARTPRRSGLRVYDGAACCRRSISGGMFVGQHGSWNRKPRSGYKVIFVPFAGRQAVGHAGRRADRIRATTTAMRCGRPVGVAIDKPGALLVADDVGNTVWRVTPETAQAASR